MIKREISKDEKDALEGLKAPGKMRERSSMTVGQLEYDSLLAAAQAAREGLDCLVAMLSQTPAGQTMLLPMLKSWFQDYETAVENFNSVSKHHIRKGNYRG